MSYVTVYAIDGQGDVLHWGEAHNNHAFAPHVWDVIARANGFKDGFPWSEAPPRAEEKRFWRLFNSGTLSERDNIVLGATYDRVYIARANLGRVAAAIREFYDETSTMPDKYRGGTYKIASTMSDTADLLVEIAADGKFRGACFNMCSANCNPWVVRWDKYSAEEKRAARAECDADKADDLLDEERPFNFDRDPGRKILAPGGDPWELFDREAYARDSDG